jgi:hypothetical protein
MIARAYEPEPEPLPRLRRQSGARVSRGAAERRRARTRAMNRRGLSQLFVILASTTIVVSGYLALLGNVMWMQLQLDNARKDRVTAQTELVDIDARLAHFESREYLLRAAARLGMHDPTTVATVTLPPPPVSQQKPSGLAFFGSWFH